jgi:hypothetical protein
VIHLIQFCCPPFVFLFVCLLPPPTEILLLHSRVLVPNVPLVEITRPFPITVPLNLRFFLTLHILCLTGAARVQTGSGAHPASYRMGIVGSAPGVKWSGPEADHSPLISAGLTIRGAIPPLPHVFVAWCFVKHRDHFTSFPLPLELPCL